MDIFKQTFEKYYEGLVRFANQYLNDIAQAEDVVQDAFVACWKEQKSLKTEEQTRAYLYVAIKNKALNVLKHEKVKANYKQNVSCENVDFESEIITEEVSYLFRTAIKKLPEQQQKVISYSLNGYKNIEISEELGISVNTVKFHKTNAYESMRKIAKYIFMLLMFLKF